ncbi:hypothetical protein CSUI_001590 [Cystoisospora suis]|uniref:Uncharacterized protein n=1 Tax=Cystoisospora suis TaxID=483139 RepID=A0A2C6LCE6_9APIC|nr:hypothetical protein CSUI_001590 [Cystoisospora suis]
MADEDPVKRRLLQRALDPTIPTSLESIAPSTVTLEARFTVVYETDPGGPSFHVGFSVLDKHYDGGFVSGWDVLNSTPVTDPPPFPSSSSPRAENSSRHRVQISKTVTTFGAPGNAVEEATQPPSGGANPTLRTTGSCEESQGDRGRQIITASTSVAVENITFSWPFCQQVADEALLVTVSRTDEALPRSAETPKPSSANQRDGALAKKGAKGDATNASTAGTKEKPKQKNPKEVKALPVFEVSRRGCMRIGSILLLSDAGCIRSPTTLNAHIETLEGLRSFELELFCSQAPLTPTLRKLVNPVCLTFVGAQRVPMVAVPSRTTPRRQDLAASESASVHDSNHNGGLKNEATVTVPPTASQSSNRGHLAAHVEAKWFPDVKVATPARAFVNPSESCANGVKCGDVTWNHDIILFWGPAVVNQLVLRQFLEEVSIPVELHDQDNLATQDERPASAPQPPKSATGSPVQGSSQSGGSKQARPNSPGTAAGTSAVVTSPQGRSGAPSTTSTAAGSKGSRSTSNVPATGQPSPRVGGEQAGVAQGGSHLPKLSSPAGKRKQATGREDDSGANSSAKNVRPHGIATFWLDDLLRHGLKSLELTSDVFPVLGTPAGGPAIFRNESEAKLFAEPNDNMTHLLPGKTRRVSTRYLDYGTQITLRVRLSETIPTLSELGTLFSATSAQDEQTKVAEAEGKEATSKREDLTVVTTEKVDLSSVYEPFSCLVLFADPSRKATIQKITWEIDRRNIIAMKVETSDALALEVLPPNDAANTTHDVLTGFVLCDEK